MDIKFIKDSSLRVTGVPFTLIVKSTFPKSTRLCLQFIMPFNTSGRSHIVIGLFLSSDKGQLNIMFLIALVVKSSSLEKRESNTSSETCFPPKFTLKSANFLSPIEGNPPTI